MLNKIKIFGQYWPKSKFFDNFYQHRNICKFLTQIDIFRKNLTIINIFCNFVQNGHFSKFWPKSRISSTFIEDRDFSKILTKFEIFVNYDQNRDLFKILTKVKIYLTILTKRNILLNFDQIDNFVQNRDCSTNFTKL